MKSEDNAKAVAEFCETLGNIEKNKKNTASDQSSISAIQGISNGKRIVTVWGAGASIPSGVPSGTYLMDRMKRDLMSIKDTEQVKNFPSGLKERAEAILGEGKKGSFEDLLEIHVNIHGENALLDWLRNHIPHPQDKSPIFFPTFAHEYCAHLASSGLLECFISLNFDEVLEDAIIEDVGMEPVQVVASLSEFERLSKVDFSKWVDQYKWHRKSIHILKPHGTISRGLTLRHLRDRVLKFEVEKRHVLEKAMREALIVLIGYSAYNEDFRLLFNEIFTSGHTGNVIIVDINPNKVLQILPPPGQREVFMFKGMADDFFKQIENQIGESGSGSISRRERHRPIRHLIRAIILNLFPQSLTKKKYESKYRTRKKEIGKLGQAWFDLRVYELELLIHLIKTRGLFKETVVANCPRIDHAYRQCLLKRDTYGVKERNLRPCNVLERILNQNGIKCVMQINPCEGTFADTAKSWCVLATHPGKIIYEENDFKEVCNDVANNYVAYLQKIFPWNKEIAWDGVIKSLATCFDKLRQDFDVDVGDANLAAMMRFDDPTPIRNRYEFTNKSKDLLSINGGTTIRLSTTSAEWLITELKNQEIKQNRSIIVVGDLNVFDLENPVKKRCVINTFHFQQMMASIVRLISELPNCNVIRLDWYLRRELTHHMTIVSEKANSKALGAIFFWRPGRSTRISPIYLSNSNDLDHLMQYFDKRLRGNEKELYEDDKISGKLFQVSVKTKKISIVNCKLGKLVESYFQPLKDQQWKIGYFN